MKDVVILGSARTPIGSFGGSLSSLPATDMGGIALKAAIERSGLKPEDIEEVIMGQILQGGVGQAPARQAAIAAGIPNTSSAWAINKACSSSLKAVMEGSKAIMVGENSVVAAGGMESMSRAPYLLLNGRTGYRYGHGEVKDGLIYDGLWDPYTNQHMGSCAEKTAQEYKITREEQDAYALESYRRSNESIEKDFFQREITPVVLKTRKGELIVDRDEEPGKVKPEKVPALRPAFAKEGTVTAANASSLNDGASAVILADADYAEENGLNPLAKIMGWSTYSHAPEWFTTAPELAIKKLLKQINWSVDDVDFFEINEAFSVVSLYNNRELGLDGSNVNVRGGAVALGHPVGASGARILVTLIHLLQDSGKKRGIAGLCNGGGEATALAIELV